MESTESIKYTDILRFNSTAEAMYQNKSEYTVAVLGNISINQSGDYLKYFLYMMGINVKIKIGNYDNIVQDSDKFKYVNCIVIFYELCNLIDGFQGSSEFLERIQIERLEERVKSDFDLICKNLQSTEIVIFNLFSAAPFAVSLGRTILQQLAEHLNDYIKTCGPGNFNFLDIEPLLYKLSIDSAINWRDFYSAKMLYTTKFFEHHSKKCSTIIAANLGKTKKALIFDCDNTLWKGIVGEDGVSGIKIPAPFAEVQALAKSLAKKGIIIGLCSKNNLDDVLEVFNKRKDMVLSAQDILIMRINWVDKVSNLLDMSKELNIGIDSFVFVDDSSFECGLIREQLPEVVVIKVPDFTQNYPRAFRDSIDLFYNSITKNTHEDECRVDMYRQEMQRKSQKEQFTDVEEYLRSLGLTLKVFINCTEQVPRLAQLTQKTNQFNLTTKRYTEFQISSLISEESVKIFSFSIADKFGDYGITGLCIVLIHGSEADIDSFLLSCRVIGRNVEFKIISYVLNYLTSNGVKVTRAYYSPTMKNSQTIDFWERAGFNLEFIDSNDYKKYIFYNNSLISTIDYITIIN